VDDVFGFVVFHCCFPVSECVKRYSEYSLVLEFLCGGLSLC